MTSNLAWQRHGCYTLGSEQYFNFPLDRSLIGCYDDWNSLDHFDPTADARRTFAQFHHLRQVYGALQDGFNLVQRGNWTYLIEREGSNHTATEMGLWSVSRAGIAGVQSLGGQFQDQVWLLYTNENKTMDYDFPCKESLWISSPYESGTTVKNLFAPYESYTLEDSLTSFRNDSQAPWQGCLSHLTMEPYAFKVLVPENIWTAPLPQLTKFVPGHDHRILVTKDQVNATTIDISLEFSLEMNCDSVQQSMSFNMSSSDKGGIPRLVDGSIKCAKIQGERPKIPGLPPSAWAFTATLENVPDGVLTINVDNPTVQGGNQTTGVSNQPRIIKLLLTNPQSRLLTI